MRFVVIENTPGYLPENDDPFITDDYEEAVKEGYHLVEQICDEYIDSFEDGIPGLYTVQHEASQNNYAAWRIIFNEPHKLDRCIEVLEDED